MAKNKKPEAAPENPFGKQFTIQFDETAIAVHFDGGGKILSLDFGLLFASKYTPAKEYKPKELGSLIKEESKKTYQITKGKGGIWNGIFITEGKMEFLTLGFQLYGGLMPKGTYVYKEVIPEEEETKETREEEVNVVDKDGNPLKLNRVLILDSVSWFVFMHAFFDAGYLKGVSAGFGYNRDFIMPGYNDLNTFPLIPHTTLTEKEKEAKKADKKAKEEAEFKKQDEKKEKEREGKVKEEEGEVDEKIAEEEKEHSKGAKEEEKEIKRRHIEADKKIMDDTPEKKKAREEIRNKEKTKRDEKREEKKGERDEKRKEEKKERDEKRAEEVEAENDAAEAAKEAKEAKEEEKERKEKLKESLAAPGEAIEELHLLEEYIIPKQDSYWGAFGLDLGFSNFTIAVVAVLRFSMEHGFEPTGFGVLGNASLAFQNKAKTKAVAIFDLNFEADYEFEKGTIAVYAVLSMKSFMLFPESKLVGGLMFKSWTKGSRKGDWVLRVGSFYPGLDVPGQYKGIAVGKGIGVRYEKDSYILAGTISYGASLSFLMFGIHSKCTWKWGSGNSKWSGSIALKLSVDVIVGWLPSFFYRAKVGVGVELSLRFTKGYVTICLSLELGIDVNIWGPEYGGEFTIEVSHFSIPGKFGEGKKQYPKHLYFKVVEPEIEDETNGDENHPEEAGDGLQKPTLRTEKPKNYNTVNVTKGLIEAVKIDDKVMLWVLDPLHFELASTTYIPANQANILGVKVDTKTEFLNRPKPGDPDSEVNNFKTEQNKGGPVFLTNTKDKATDNKLNANFLNDYRVEDQKAGLAEMGLKITSPHTIGLYTLNTDPSKPGFKGDPLKGFHVRLDKGNYQKKLFGNKPLDVDNPHNNNFKTSQIEDALSGVTLMPPLFFPAKTRSIPFYYLIFSLGNEVYGGKKELATETIAEGSAVKGDLSFENTKNSIDALKGITAVADLFDHLEFVGQNTNAKIKYWDQALACDLASETNQFVVT